MPPTTMIMRLSDKELAQRLRDHGVNVGPIVNSTRGLYEKKLQRLEFGNINQPAYEEVPDDDDDDDDEEEEEEDLEEENEISFTLRQTEPRHRLTPSRQKEPVIVEKKSTRTHSSPQLSKKEDSRGYFSIWMLLLILLVLGGLGYLILKNMEPAAENIIPGQTDAQV